MAVAKVLQLIWASFLALMIGLPAFASGTILGVSIGVIAFLYLAATLACLRNSRIGWIVALVIPVLPLLRWIPMAMVNLWMFFTGHELYQDSPATIVIVLINTIMFVVPGLLIYLCIFLDHRRFLAVMRASGPIADGYESPRSAAQKIKNGNPYTPPGG